MKSFESLTLGLLFAGGYLGPAVLRQLADRVEPVEATGPAHRPPAPCACDALPMICCA